LARFLPVNNETSSVLSNIEMADPYRFEPSFEPSDRIIRLLGGFLRFKAFNVYYRMHQKRRKNMSKSRQGGGYEGKRGHGKGF
jgi:hypothetical protein